MIGSLASVVLPDSLEPLQPPLGLDPLHVDLFERFAIELPVTRWPSPPAPAGPANATRRKSMVRLRIARRTGLSFLVGPPWTGQR